MPLFPDFKKSIATDCETPKTVAHVWHDDSPLRDFCKAKAEVIRSGETTHALRELPNPFKEK